MGILGLPKKVLFFSNTLVNWSGRQDSNLRRTAWKADTLPLSYARFKECSATLGGNYTASGSLLELAITHSLHPLPDRVRSRIASAL